MIIVYKKKIDDEEYFNYLVTGLDNKRYMCSDEVNALVSSEYPHEVQVEVDNDASVNTNVFELLAQYDTLKDMYKNFKREHIEEFI